METTGEGGKARYKRIVLKISGEVLRCTESGETIDGAILHRVCEDIKTVYDLGIEIGLVVGGGNIFRGLSGAEKRGVARTTGDYMGMLATVINGMALMDCLEKMKVPVRVLSDALKKRLKVMDATAFAMCLENNMPILVFNMNTEGNIRKAVQGEKIGTLVHQAPHPQA